MSDLTVRNKLFTLIKDFHGITIEAFAQNIDRSKQVVSQVLTGATVSRPVCDLIDKYIAENIADLHRFIEENLPKSISEKRELT